ncbi:hypothetical protein ACHAW6_012118 [Cyclotella cf. meneghiniana]
MDEDGEDFSPTRFKGGVETLLPMRDEQQEDTANESHDALVDLDEAEEEDCTPQRFDGVDSYQSYRDAVFTYLHNRERIANLSMNKLSLLGEENSLMQIDHDEGEQTALAHENEPALGQVDIKFLDTLAAICFSQCNDQDLSDEWRSEGNFWDLLASLRSRGLPSLFYCVNGETPPDLTLNADPKTMLDSSPAEVLAACLETTSDEPPSLPLERLNAALEWIQSCHARKWEQMLAHNYRGNEDPLLPPSRRRAMWPSTLEAMKRGNAASKQFHPDAPLLSKLRPSSPTNVTLHLSDESDDARLLRACLVLIQSGRHDQAIQLTKECGQPWRSIGWTGGEPLDDRGNGNPTRRLWKRQCRVVAEKMTRMCHGEEEKRLHSSLAYEAAILALLSDNVDCALSNPVFSTWEDAVHAILSAERGIIEEDVLRCHNDARVEACGEGSFPYPGMERGEDDGSPIGFDGDLDGALQRLEGSSVENVREGSGDPYRSGMRSFLVGREALKNYIEECSALALEWDDEDQASFLRFVVHLVLYVDTVLPEFSLQLAVPDSVAPDGSVSLCEALLLKYTAQLSSRRERWAYVPLYTSLLSNENILAKFSDFLVHVHSDRERQMMLRQARELFPAGFDRYVLRNVVREMIQCDEEEWKREAGEDLPPAGIPASDARMMRSILWLCYYPEHRADALVCANILLRRFLLTSGNNDQYSKNFMVSAKFFIEQILPRDILETAGMQTKENNDDIAGSITVQLVQNLQAEFLSINRFLQAHTHYVHFNDVMSRTSPCHQSESKSVRGSTPYETEIAHKLERNAFRQKKVGLCKIVIEYSTKVSEALIGVLTIGGGWLVDQTSYRSNQEEDKSEEAEARSEEMEEIRSKFIPVAIFMLHEVLNKTAMWMEQMIYDTLDQFGSSAPDMLLSLLSTFDESNSRSTASEATNKLLTTSRAAPAYWHKKALSLSGIVANDGHMLHHALSENDTRRFLSLMADSQVGYNECSKAVTLFDVGLVSNA